MYSERRWLVPIAGDLITFSGPMIGADFGTG